MNSDNTKSDVTNSGKEEHPLQRKWIFWVHEPCFDGKYENTRKPLHVSPITSIECFWRYYNNIPEPSKFFFADGERRAVGGVILEGWSFFEEGVKPDWEDPRNKQGSTITFKASFSSIEIDKIWKHSLLGLIGETIDESSHIAGIRVIDRAMNYRLEIWLDTNEPQITNKVKGWFMSNIIGDVSSAVLCFNNVHETEKKVPVTSKDKKPTALKSRQPVQPKPSEWKTVTKKSVKNNKRN